MITSAQALNQFFASVLKVGAEREKFLTVAATVLGFEGDDAEARSLLFIHQLLKRVRSDIDDLPFDEKTKAQARSYLNPFEPLFNFSQFYLDIHSAKGNFLAAANLVGLTNLHMALWGNAKVVIAPKELLELAKEFRERSFEIGALELPDNIRKAIHKRLEQISSMLENYYFYGGEQIKDEFEALAGTIVFNASSAGDSGQSFFKKTASALAKGMKILSATDSSLGVALGVLKKGKEALQYFDDGDG